VSGPCHHVSAQGQEELAGEMGVILELSEPVGTME
jgi:hypothetical protein